MKYFADSLTELAEAFARLPGIGLKSAQRLAFYIIRQPEDEVRKFAEALLKAKSAVGNCSVCCNLTDTDPCDICSDPRRDRETICVVEDPRDVAAIERTHEYRGLYHVLHGAFSPMEGIGPDELKIKELLARVSGDEVHEIIVATNSSVEGEATALYLARIMKPLGIKVTRIAQGMPVGGDIEYADEVTLSRAFAGRREI